MSRLRIVVWFQAVYLIVGVELRLVGPPGALTSSFAIVLTAVGLAAFVATLLRTPQAGERQRD